MSQIDIKDASNMEDLIHPEIKKLFSDIYKSLDSSDYDRGLESLIDEYCKDSCLGSNGTDTDLFGYAFPWLKKKSESDKNTSTQHQETPYTNTNNNINRRPPKSNNRFNNYSKSNKANKDSSNKETHNSPYINIFPGGYSGINQKKTQVHGGVETAKKCCCNDNKSTAKSNAKVTNDNDMLKQILYEVINLRTTFVATMGTLKIDIVNDVKKLIVEHDNRLIAKLKHDLAGKDKEISELNEKLKDYNEMTNLMQSFFGKTPSELSSK